MNFSNIASVEEFITLIFLLWMQWMQIGAEKRPFFVMRRDSEDERERSERRSVSEGKCGHAGAGERVHSRDEVTRLGPSGVSVSDGASRRRRCRARCAAGKDFSPTVFIWKFRWHYSRRETVVISEPERGIMQVAAWLRWTASTSSFSETSTPDE